MVKSWNLIFLCTFLFCGVVFNAQAASVQWTANYSSALSLAKDTKKPLFVLFTGEQWCKFCQKLDQEVLNTSEFADAFGNKFVFVKMNFAPMGKAAHPNLGKEHEKLAAKHQLQGYPTVLVLDTDEKVLLRTGYRNGGVDSYIDFLKGSLKNIAFP